MMNFDVYMPTNRTAPAPLVWTPKPTAAPVAPVAGADRIASLVKATVDGFSKIACSIVRDDTRAELAHVSPSYGIVQYSDALAPLAGLIDAAGGECLLSAGVVDGGARAFVTVQPPKLRGEIVKGDIVQGRVTITAGHGSVSWSADYDTVRLICLNGMTALTRAKLFRVSHTALVMNRKDWIETVVAGATDGFAKQIEAGKALAAKRMQSDAVHAWLGTLFVPSDPESKRAVANAKRQSDEVYALIEGGIGQDIAGVGGTAWAAYNGLTQWVDYTRLATRSTGDDRALDLINGDGAKIKSDALDSLLALL